MPEKIKLGLTRNRLFEFDNCVGFLGEVEYDFDIKKCEKALKILSLKEPLLCCGVELCEDGEAYLVTEQHEMCFEVFDGDKNEYLKNINSVGFDFSGKLFSFVIINSNALGIFAHTVIADARSLMYLAGEFINIYKNESASVVPSEIKVISEISQMPSNVFSVVVDRLASDLEVGWQKKTKTFTYDDYVNAREKYISSKKEMGGLFFEIDESLFFDLKKFAVRECADVSSLVAFAFYECLTEALGGRRKYRKMNIQANERVFLPDINKIEIGAFNGAVVVEKKKNKKIPDTLLNNAVAFHKEIYKRITSAFSVFYNEFLFMRLPASFTDSQYMYCAGKFQHKYSKKLATIYGCANEVVGEFCSFNLNQKIWSDLDNFKSVASWEPLKMRSSSMIVFLEKRDRGYIYFNYKKDKISDDTAKSIAEKVVSLLRELK